MPTQLLPIQQMSFSEINTTKKVALAANFDMPIWSNSDHIGPALFDVYSEPGG